MHYRPIHGDGPLRIIQRPHGWLEYRFGPGKIMELCTIEVDNEWRDQGIGSAMIREAESLPEIKTHSIRIIYGFVRQENEAVQRFYRRLGYELIPIGSFYGRNENAFMVHKVLE
jgi:ribosomal protein S18 acetylase RimI-like enzyme